MPITAVQDRLEGLNDMLIAAHKASKPFSSATKGSERETFVDYFLSKVLPPIYRVGRGDIVDQIGNQTGQLDIVIEYPFLPSLPSFAGNERLYLAEGVAAVVEVKSNLSSQWNEVLATKKKLDHIQRMFHQNITKGNYVPKGNIPLFVVGYDGWSNLTTIEKKAKESGIAGIFIVNESAYASGRDFNFMGGNGAWGIWSFICCLHQVTSSLQSTNPDPFDYLL